MYIVISFGRIITRIDRREAFRIDNAKLCIYYFFKQSYEIGIFFFVYYISYNSVTAISFEGIFVISLCLWLIIDIETRSASFSRQLFRICI